MRKDLNEIEVLKSLKQSRLEGWSIHVAMKKAGLTYSTAIDLSWRNEDIATELRLLREAQANKVKSIYTKGVEKNERTRVQRRR